MTTDKFVYDTKRGHYIEDCDLKEIADDIFNGDVIDTFSKEIELDSEGVKPVNGYEYRPATPFIETVLFGEIVIGNSRKNWLFFEIEEVSDQKKADLLESATEKDIEVASTGKTRFVHRVTGYDASDLADKAKQDAKGYSSLKEA